MNIREWDERYRSGSRQGDRNTEPTLLVAETVKGLKPGRALDLACGVGRNAIFLAEAGWDVTAVDGSPAAIEILQSKSRLVKTAVADLEKHEFVIAPGAWDLILSCYYLNRELMAEMGSGAKPGGLVIVIAHTPEQGQEMNEKRAAPGELRKFFQGEAWEIAHHYEGVSRDPVHKRPVAEIVARRR